MTQLNIFQRVKKLSSVWRYYAAAVFLGFIFPGAAYAAGAISQGYTTSSSNITQGALLSLASSSSTNIVLANSDNAAKLIGVAASKPLLQLSSDHNTNVQVVVSGTTQVLVSDINGNVQAGDKITASPVSGVGMKAISATEIVGTAQASLSSVSTAAESVATKDGQHTNIKVGLVPVAITVAYYATAPQGVIASLVPAFLQSIANSLANRQASPLRVLLGTLALLLGFLVAAIMLYVSIRTGIISIGRNPLASRVLRREVAEVLVAAVGILSVTIIAVYVIVVS